MAPQTVVIPSEQFKFLSLLGIWLKGSQTGMIAPHNIRQHVSIKGIAFGLAHPKPIPSSIQSFGVDRIDHYPMIQQKIHNPPLRLLNARRQLDSLRPTLVKPAAKLTHGFGFLSQFYLDYFFALSIADPNLMKLIGPIHTQIVSLQLLLLLLFLFPFLKALNGVFALYRSSRGQLSIEPLAPFSRWPGQSALDPHGGLGFDGPHASKLSESVLNQLTYSNKRDLTNIRLREKSAKRSEAKPKNLGPRSLTFVRDDKPLNFVLFVSFVVT
jgi:hypothetical protein